MFNRANKMTALLVAAAAVVSLVPATGVNAADVKRIDSEEGTVYNAVAYKDGKAYVDGEIKDNQSVFYYADGKFSELEKVDTDSDMTIYGDKYVNVDDGDYFVDLTNGKVTDEDVKEDAEDDAASALRKKIKDDTDDRYDEAKAKDMQDLKDKEIKGTKFGEIWYATTFAKATKSTANAGQDFNIFTDAKGNYIDADYNLGEVRVETTGSSVKIKNTNDKEDFGNSKKVDENSKKTDKDSLTASVKQDKVLAQDAKYIYRTATITLTVDEEKTDSKIKEVYGIEVNKTFKDGKAAITSTDGGKTVTFDVIQKISKEQDSDDVDGAKYAKSVTNYVICNDKGEEKTLLADAEFTAVDGKLVSYAKDGDKKVKVQTIKFDKDHNLYYTDLADDSSEDVEVEGSKQAVDVDVDGNLWRLDGGYVYKWDNDEDWDKVYKVDGSMNELSVYNKENVVLWNEDDEVYSIVNAKEDKKDEETKVEVKAGWNQAADGTWSFVKADNTKATGWLQDGANWYLLNDAGVMQTGWQNVAGTWYYLAGNGAMATGWQNLGGAWYNLAGNGAMQTGWINDNGTWYFCDASGKMLANTTVNGYVLGANGAWVK